MSSTALFTIAKIWKQPKCPLIDEWTKQQYIYAMEYHPDIKDNEMLPFTIPWIGPENVK